MLAARLRPAAPAPLRPASPAPKKRATAPRRQRAQSKPTSRGAADGVAAIGKFLQSREGKQLQRQVVRGVFGLLKKHR
jgi:hypothetical protein